MAHPYIANRAMNTKANPATQASPCQRFLGHTERRRARPARPLSRVRTPSAGGSRYRLIQRLQCGSCPIITSAPITAWIVSACNGLVMADVIPAPIAILRKAAFNPCLLGKPKLTFDAPQVVLTFSSSRRRHHKRINNNIRTGDSVIFCPLDNFLCYRKTHIRVLGNTCFII